MLLRSLFALKNTILMPEHVLTQLGMCTQTLITLVSEGLIANNMIFDSVLSYAFCDRTSLVNTGACIELYI